MYYYQCIKCNHITKQKIEMKRHLNRKFKCQNINEIEYEDDYVIFEKSLVRNKLNKDKTFDKLKEETDKQQLIVINKLSNFECQNCNAHFLEKEKYDIHIQEKYCFQKNQSITNILNQQNIININFQVLKPFDEEWDIGNIDYALKHILLMSSLKYTKTLEHILKNENNLNVFIENLDYETGIVYANKNEKFKEMSIKDIVDITMEKISKHLQNFHDQIMNKNIYQIDNDYLADEKQSIITKLDEYKNNKNVQEKVQSFLTKIFNSKKKDSIRIFKELIDKDKKSLLDGY